MFLRTRQRRAKPKSTLREYVATLLWALLLAAVIRTWVVQSFMIPSGSMKPTLLVGDRLLVFKSAYGLREPFGDHVLLPVGDPQRGDIVVFRFPEDRSVDFIKRAIGLPGDTVQVVDKKVFINGEPLLDPWGRHTDPTTLSAQAKPRDNMGPVVVPPDQYFVMGDNRDESYDSRLWFNDKGGFVPRKDILGKAVMIYWAWEDESWGVRWSRLGNLLF